MQRDRTNLKDKRQCREIWAAKNPNGIWYVYGSWGQGSNSVTKTLGFRRSKKAAEKLVTRMKRLYY